MAHETNQPFYNLEPARPGQLIGIRQCLDNFHNREPYTPIILPTRYGKSDLIRLSAIIAWAKGYISLAIVLSPNAILRDQIFSKEKFSQMVDRYSLNIPDVKYRIIDTYKDWQNLIANEEMMLSMTIQLAKDMKFVLLDLIEHLEYETGKPVVIYIDETQLMSIDNTWGDLAIECEKARALIVPVTATPFRTDGYDIPGIKTIALNSEKISYYTAKREDENKIKVYQWEADKETRIMDLDWVKEKGVYVPFRTAWNENLLCHFTHVPFDPILSRELLDEIQPDNELGEADIVNLSELTPGQLRQHSILSKILRDSQVIISGCQLFYDRLMARKKVSSEIAGIIYCGNDFQSEKGIDQHAKKIKRILLQIDPSLQVIIATSSQENEGSKEIIQFAQKEMGDVLIVKQMGGAGLDVPRAKTELDLSSWRTANAFIQRANRVATPYKEFLTCDFIAPMDCLMMQLFHAFIEDEGGTESSLKNKELVRSYIKEEDPTPKMLWGVDDISMGNIEDSKGNILAPEDYPSVDRLCEMFPIVRTAFTDPEISERIKQGGWQLVAIEEPENINIKIAGYQNDCLDLAHECARYLLAKKYNGDFDRFGEVISGVWNESKKMAGISTAINLNDIDNIAQLKYLKRILNRMVSNIRDW